MNNKLKNFKKQRQEFIDEEKVVAAKLEAVTNDEEMEASEQTAQFDTLSLQSDEWHDKIERSNRMIKQEERRVKIDETLTPEKVVGEFADDATLDQMEPAYPKWRGGMDAFAFSVHQSGLANGRMTENFVGYQSALEIFAAATGMNAQIGSEGAFLLPAELSTIIWDGMQADESNLLALTDNFTVTGESLTFNANAETSRATGSRWGGVRAYWVAEAQQKTSSFPKFREVKLEPKELAVLVYTTDKLLRGAGPALEQYLTRSAISEIGFMTSDAIINGDGSGKPLGILNSTAVVSVTKETGQAADTIVAENISKMWSRCHSRSRPSSVWYNNQDIEPQLDKLQVPVGTGGSVVYLPAGGYAAAPLGSMKGRPVQPIEFCPTLGDKGDLLLADLKAYVTGTRGSVETAMSIHLRFDYNETAFRFVFEVDGQPWMASPITPFKGTATLSPFVAMQNRT